MGIRALKIRKVISIQRPGLWFLSALGVLLLIALLVWVAYEYGRNVAGYDRVEATAVIDDLYQKIHQIQQEKADIEQQNAMLERNSRIDGDAGKHLESNFGEIQTEVHELKKELEFYKSIVSPGQSKKSKVVIQAIQLHELEDRQYRYKVTVSQKGRNDNFVKGVLKMTIIGHNEGQPVTLDMSEVTDGNQKLYKFGFKYFQNFEGAISLPENFYPEYMQVLVKPKSRLVETVDKKFTWSDLTAGEIKYVGQ